jgi:hypothetical protein
MSEYPDNSISAQEKRAKESLPAKPEREFENADEEGVVTGKKPPAEKVITGKVVRRKKSLVRRFAETFIEGDVESIGDYVVRDVLVPAAKDAIRDVVSQGIERMLFGEERRSRRPSEPRNRYTTGGYRNYGSYSSSSSRRERDRDEPRRAAPRRARSRVIDEIEFERREDAERILDEMTEAVDMYGSVTVLDFLTMAGAEHDFTQERYGWEDVRDLKHVRIERLGSDRYILKLPDPVLLED